MALSCEVSATHCVQGLHGHRVLAIDLRPVKPIGRNPGPLGEDAGVQSDGVHFGGGDKNGMVVLKVTSFLCESVQGRRVLRTDDVRPHPVPDHHDHMFCLPSSSGVAVGLGKSSDRKDANHHSHCANVTGSIRAGAR